VPERYSIEFLPSAARELEKIPRDVRGRLVDAIDSLAAEPRPNTARLLSGTGADRIWRIRVGSYRVLYQIIARRITVVVVRVADRREVYDRTALKRLLDRLGDTR
jgi:mRNA interferase RelE/StbE